ncbi:uncharacterized protein LOC128206824 isoform X2 [Mya arenaria]|uniref:uncharacterized protein LOC128206824 isoform X2 n=1 Tax=Mya arenaria TaxID=6604 RepID=UPI0022E3B26B|nr:uncharacterized protein LOC128206824 isoform X2 [Mya arenaria]
MWNDMFLLKLLVLFFRLLSTEGKELKLWMFPEVVNEFQPLTLICDVEEVNETWIVDWIRNKTGTTELHLESPCASAMNSTEDYTISCLTNQQHNLTINNVTRLNHGDLWHCRDRNNTKYQSNGVVVQVRELNDKKRLYRSWLTLAFSIRQDWTVVYCTTNNFMSLSNRVTIHVIKRNGVGEHSHGDTIKIVIGLSSIIGIGTTSVFVIVGYVIIKKRRSLEANSRKKTHTPENVNQANDEAKENTSHSTKSSTVNRLTTAVYENTTIGAP